MSSYYCNAEAAKDVEDLKEVLLFNYPAGNKGAEKQAIENVDAVIGRPAIACARDPKGHRPAIEIAIKYKGQFYFRSVSLSTEQIATEEIKVGDVVKLKSGGPDMTVIGHSGASSESITTMWFVEGDAEPHGNQFPINSLTKIKLQPE